MIYFSHETERKIQKALTVQVYNAVKNKENLIAHAPTGIGKTASALSACLSYALENNKVVFFATPRHSQHKIAVETLKMIKEKHGLRFKAVDLIGKKWMCLQSGVSELYSGEFSDYCKDLRKKELCEFYEKFKNRTLKSLCVSEIELPMHVEDAIKICRKHKMCPYEVSCELAKSAVVIIADYFHILNPSIRDGILSRIKRESSDCIFIFDEAHNLADKCRELLTAKTSTMTVENAIRECRKYFFDYANELKAIGERLLELSRKTPIEATEALINKKDFSFNEELIGNLKNAADEVRKEQKRSYIGTVAGFLEAWLGNDFGFARILSKGFTRIGKPFISLAYRCLDPSLLMKFDAHSLVLMSGTLAPCEMHRDLLGINAIVSEYNSPFPKQNKLSLIVPDTSTKFELRNEEMYKRISDRIAGLAKEIPGNVAVFFPSYELRDKVNRFFAESSSKSIFTEQPGMNKFEREELIRKFKEYKDTGAVMLGVASGSFGEGIDLPGKFLQGVIIVGLPLTRPSLETKELIKYYDARFKGKGMDYGYIFPALIKSVQNAGRCVRSENDRGVVVFLDERYAWQRYRKFLDAGFITTMKPEEKIKGFFGDRI